MANTANATKTTRKNAAASAIRHVEAGPRGFRFGYAYVESIVNGEGIAAKEANKQKLVAFAAEVGVEGITMKSDIPTALKSLKKAAQKFLRANFEAPTVH